MLVFLFIISTTLFFTFLFFALFQFLFKRNLRIYSRMHNLTFPNKHAKNVEKDERDEESIKNTSFRTFILFGSKMFKNHMNTKQIKHLEKQLSNAGNPFELNAFEFQFVKVFISFSFSFFIFSLFFSYSKNFEQLVFFSFSVALFGFLYPDYYLKAKAKQRFLLIDKQMPDFFDMVNVSVEAGMGLDIAINKISKEMKGPLSNEFLITLNDMKLGKSKKDAFTLLKERIPSEQFQSVISALIQAEQMGISVTKTLKEQTKQIREKRLQLSKEKAMKAPIKMMIPMILFIFPTLFIVLLGPIVIQLFTEWF